MIYTTGLLLLYFDIITRLSVIIILVYISLYLIKSFKRYKQVFSSIIYYRDYIAINTLEAVFLIFKSILYVQYIDTIVEVQTYKIFRQQRSEDSELAIEFLILYRIYRLVKTEQLFKDAYLAILIYAMYDDTSYNNTSNSKNTKAT